MTDPGPRRKKTIALVLSGVFPGLGQFYNRDHVRGALFLVAGIVLSWLLGRTAPADLTTFAEPKPDLLVSLLALVVIWIWSIIDAWRAADRRAP